MMKNLGVASTVQRALCDCAAMRLCGYAAMRPVLSHFPTCVHSRTHMICAQ